MFDERKKEIHTLIDGETRVLAVEGNLRCTGVFGCTRAGLVIAAAAANYSK